MAKYKTAFCPLCGTPNPKKTVYLADGSIVCENCTQFVINPAAKTLETVGKVKAEQDERRKLFRATRVNKSPLGSEQSLNIDDQNKLFWVGKPNKPAERIYAFHEVYSLDRRLMKSGSIQLNSYSDKKSLLSGPTYITTVQLDLMEGPGYLQFSKSPRSDPFRNFLLMCRDYRAQYFADLEAKKQAELEQQRKESIQDLHREIDGISKMAAGDRLVSDKATEDLVRYNELLYAGIITEEQFEEIKKRIIGI